MKKRLLMIAAAAAMVVSGYAQLLRQEATEYITAPTASVPAAATVAHHKVKDATLTSVRLKAPKAKTAAPTIANAAAKGRFQGLKVWNSRGWYQFNTGGTSASLMWTPELNASGFTGFVADGLVYVFHYAIDTSGSLLGMGLNIFNLESGAPVDSETYDLFGGYDKVVYGAAYNEEEGVAYLVCGQASNANRYSYQKFIPSTRKFVEVANLPTSTPYPYCMAWHPRNGGIYMIDEYAKLMRYNESTGAFKSVGDTNLEIDDYTGYPGAMIYSPKDEAFVALIETGENYTSFYSVNPVTAASKTLSALGDDSQWRILYCLDSNADPEAPAEIESVTANFAAGSMSGNLAIKLPALTTNGQALSGDVYVRVTEGSNVLSENVHGAPGAIVNVPLTLSMGDHTLAVAAYVKSGADTLVGSKTVVNVYIGSDVPAAPASVTLSANKVSWTASAAANGGYIDASAVKYNVYIDDVLVAGSPFSGTSVDITLPATGNVAHIAQVEAVMGAYTSARTASNVVVGAQPFGLPCAISPVGGSANLEPAVINLFTSLDVNNDGRKWIYDEQKEQTGGFYYLCHASNKADDWLLLPQMTFPKAGYYRFSCEVTTGFHYFSGIEHFEFGIGKEAYAPSMKVLSEVFELAPRKLFEPFEFIFKVEEPGNYFVGLHCVSNPNIYRLYARNFLVEAVQASVAAPAAPSAFEAQGAENGVLQALVSFTMPTKDVEGNDLDASTTLTATITCSEHTATLAGLPGQQMNGTVDADQGVNNVAVRVSSEDGGEGPSVNLEIYAGVDVPDVLDLYKVVSADNMSVTLKWECSTVGANGGYVDPAICEYIVYRATDSGSYVQYASAGTGSTEWPFTVPAGSAQEIYFFGVLPVNVAGNKDSFAICDVILGKLNELPMEEQYSSRGNDVVAKYEPLAIQNVTDVYCSWAFVDPSTVDASAGNSTETAVYAYYQGIGQMTLPRFNTAGVDNVKISVSMYHSPMSSSEVTIAAATPADSFYPIETVNLNEGEGWQTTTVTLPTACLGQGWAALTLRCYNPTYAHFFMFDGYTVEAYNGSGVDIIDVAVNNKLRVGNVGDVLVTLANYGATDVAVPDMTVAFHAESGAVAYLEGAPEVSTIGRGQKCTIAYELPVMPEHLGYGKVKVAITNPAAVGTTGTAEKRVNVVKGYNPHISDLSLSGGKLSWTPLALNARVVEGAEDFDPWQRGEKLGDFRNLDYDQLTTYYISEVSYPGKYEAKAFEIFAGSDFSLMELQAYQGDQYFMVFSPDSKTTMPADDWLISPRIAGGTEVSMQILAPSNQWGEEELELLYSTSSDDTADFTTLETFTTANMKWQSVSARLPITARYFALRYKGQNRFCLMIDNITFTPYDNEGYVRLYKIYKNGALIGSTEGSEFEVAATETDTFYIAPIITHADGTESEGMRSNIVSGSQSGLLSPGYAGGIRAEKGGVAIEGFEGATARVFAADGTLVAIKDNLSAEATIALAPGIYIVNVDGTVAKVAVK